ncbi:MAG: HAF repeat-containing protein [Fimbriimonadales bacterium]|jgi:probable HAF family extracellular repeat protein|nr:HAF repeat-containing protein [Fimbriimonadales bacterium]GBC90049.1 hypothetical protein HRbin14_00781 [bacterium HR14]CUU11442.1 probable extracellular repeat, HAF family [Armatimonadetes bacterium GBS]
MRQTAQNRFYALISASVLSLLATAGWSQSLTWLGALPDGRESVAYAVSQDGRVVVGIAYNSGGYPRAFRWTPTDGMVLLSNNDSAALGVSANGAIVVGWVVIGGIRRGFRWSSGNMQEMRGDVTGVSASGAAATGYYFSSRYYAYRWTQTEGSDSFLEYGRAYAISLDGTVVVGEEYIGGGRSIAFRKRFPGEFQRLGTLGGGSSVAYAVSGDGAVVVGKAQNTAQFFRPFRWTEETGMQDLGSLGGNTGEARAVSADGSVVVGWATDEYSVPRAFRWIEGHGIQNLNEVYANLLLYGSELLEAYGISPNGRYIVGRGFNAYTGRFEAFLLDTGGTTGCRLDSDVNRDGVVDDADLLQVLFNFGSSCGN